MSFEVKEKDLLARIGRLRTKSGTVETPLLFPVVNLSMQLISPRRIREEFGFDALITNAYILKKRFNKKLTRNGLHRLLGFDGLVMTDSGAYQILVYGDIETSPEEIVEYQERIGPDIATILDIPTGWKVTENHARQTVEETIRRARQLFALKTRDDILWVGPVQGGRYLNLVTESAREMGKLPFHIHALGSPTEVMKRYRFDVLVDMIMTAKMNLPIDRPLHLFGAGHPFMFTLAVALGCDFFDSAAYALYAKEGRYMTETGTRRLSELEYFPCSCPRCARTAPSRVSKLPSTEAQSFLAEHNLYVCNGEMKRIKQAIKDGRLWEHLEMQAHNHPALLQAVKRLKKYEDYVEKHDPCAKKSGLFFFSSLGLMRPEIVRYRRKLKERYTVHKQAKVLLLVPQTQTKPFHKSRAFVGLADQLSAIRGSPPRFHICFYASPFGVVPSELDEVYPLSQHETALPPDRETLAYVADQVADFVSRTDYETVVLLNDSENWRGLVASACRKACAKKSVTFRCVNVKRGLRMSSSALHRLLAEEPGEKV
jgi:7-cyano-7-deazaguanine tRNA-ribosyltransferase